MRIYVEREVAGMVRGFVPRRVVEHLEGPKAGPSLVAMYEAADAGGVPAILPGAGVAAGLGTALRPEDEAAPAMAWGAAAWAWLDAKAAMAEAAWSVHTGARWVWPRVGVGAVGGVEVLSDVPSLRRFLKDREGGGWRFALDPVGMVADSMVANAEEHVKRVLEMLGSHEACGAVVLKDLAVDAHGRGVCVPVGAGELSRRGLLEWWRGNCPAELPVILGVDAALSEQAGWVTSG